jgi:hypothetical protein
VSTQGSSKLDPLLYLLTKRLFRKHSNTVFACQKVNHALCGRTTTSTDDSKDHALFTAAVKFAVACALPSNLTGRLPSRPLSVRPSSVWVSEFLQDRKGGEPCERSTGTALPKGARSGAGLHLQGNMDPPPYTRLGIRHGAPRVQVQPHLRATCSGPSRAVRCTVRSQPCATDQTAAEGRGHLGPQRFPLLTSHHH